MCMYLIPCLRSWDGILPLRPFQLLQSVHVTLPQIIIRDNNLEGEVYTELTTEWFENGTAMELAKNPTKNGKPCRYASLVLFSKVPCSASLALPMTSMVPHAATQLFTTAIWKSPLATAKSRPPTGLSHTLVEKASGLNSFIDLKARRLSNGPFSIKQTIDFHPVFKGSPSA